MTPRDRPWERTYDTHPLCPSCGTLLYGTSSSHGLAFTKCKSKTDGERCGTWVAIWTDDGASECYAIDGTEHKKLLASRKSNGRVSRRDLYRVLGFEQFQRARTG